MSKQITVPFGPQHPVLPEPIHLDLVLEDERVVDVIPSIGYVHRGLEKLVEKREYPEYIYVAERICGICSYIHSNTYAEGIEQIMKVEVPERAQYLRTIWSEYSRLHSHLLWLGLFADGMGFENLFMTAWKLREHILDDMEATTGGRVIQGVCKVGGVRKDITPEKLDGMLRGLKDMEPQLRDLTNVFLNDASVSHRLKGIGSAREGGRLLPWGGRPDRPGERGRNRYPPDRLRGLPEDQFQTRRGALRGQLRPLRGAGKGTLHLDRYHRTVRKEDPRGTGRGKSGGGPERRVFLPRRAAPGRGRPLHQGERQAKPRPAPGADTDVYEHPAAADNAEGLRTGRRADHRAVDRPLYRLFGEVNEAMTYFEMTKTMVKSLFSRPATLMYPAKPAKKTPLSRGHVTINPDGCITCRSCQRKCPAQAICVEVKEKTWQIDRLRCVVCDCCVEVCPTKCLTMDTQYSPATTTHAGLYKVPVAGPKKKEPAPAADGAAVDGAKPEKKD